MKLIYLAIASLDGYIEDAAGDFQWAAPDEEVHGFVNDLERPVGTYLYGRRMYETMVYWETAHELRDPSPAVRDYTDIWQAADKVVFSKTLGEPSSARTVIEREFDPERIRTLKASAAHAISVGGPDLAGQALAAGLVDELQLISVPVLVGGGKRALPTGVRARSWNCSTSGGSRAVSSSSATRSQPRGDHDALRSRRLSQSSRTSSASCIHVPGPFT